MIRPSVVIRCESNGRTFRPGDSLRAEYHIESVLHGEVKSIEASVLWHTDGKGDQDLSVHEFLRVVIDERRDVDPRCPGEITTVLPNSPLSYEGQIVKLRWYVRVRAFLTGGREIVGQFAFRLGTVTSQRATGKIKTGERGDKPPTEPAKLMEKHEPTDRPLPGESPT